MDLIKDFFLESNPNPERIGCPEERTLRALAEDRLSASHPARLHLASCSKCFAEFRGYRGDWEHSRKVRRRIIGWAVAASLILASGVGVWEYEHQRVERYTAGEVVTSNVPSMPMAPLISSRSSFPGLVAMSAPVRVLSRPVPADRPPASDCQVVVHICQSVTSVRIRLISCCKSQALAE